MRASEFREDADHAWPAIMTRSVEMSDAGLVVGARSLLARMSRTADGAPRLALEADRERCLAMLSVAWGRPVGADILRHVAAASDHWQRGDKALANLRLVFADLPRLADPADGYRLCLAEYLLDEGMAPDALMKELGFAREANDLVKYNPDQPRVPAGNGTRSGEWDFGTGGFAPGYDPFTSGSIVVAQDYKPPEHKKPLERPGPLSVDSDAAGQEHHPNPLDLTGVFEIPGDVRPGGPAVAVARSPTADVTGSAGGRLGGAATRALNAAIANHLESQGYDVIHGGGRRSEEYIPGVGPATRGSTFVDMTVQNRATGAISRIQTIDTLADGSPTSREAAAANRIRSAYPNDSLYLIRKR